MAASAKSRRISTAMETGDYGRFDYLPEHLPDERVFRLVECVKNTTSKESEVPARHMSPLTGRFLSPRFFKLQLEASKLPAARARNRIQEAVEESSVVILQGDTGSGKSTQVPQIALELIRENIVNDGLVVHVCPLVEPLFGLHARLENEMEAHKEVHLATGQGSFPKKACRLALMTTGVLMNAWWEVIPKMTVLILDEVHIRSIEYTNLFQMVKRLLQERSFKLIIMSATLHISKWQTFFQEFSPSVLEISGRQFPLFVFEPEVDLVFDTDEALQDAMVHMILAEAEVDRGGILGFLRGQTMIECVHNALMQHTQQDGKLQGWRVYTYFSKAEEELKQLVWEIADDCTKAIVLTTEGLGAGKPFIPFRTVISSCEVLRKLNQTLMGVVANSQEAVMQEGGRVGRAAFLGPGRLILLRQKHALPETHTPEIRGCVLHKTTLRLVRDGLYGKLDATAWPPGEEPIEEELKESFEFLQQLGCIAEHDDGTRVLTTKGTTMLTLPTGCDYANLILLAEGTLWSDNIIAGVAFLEAAVGGSLIANKDNAETSTEYRLCGRRLSGEQDDFLRFSHFTMLAYEQYYTLKPLSIRLNVHASVLARAAEIYGKLYKRMQAARRNTVSENIVKTVKRWIQGNHMPSDADANALVDSIKILSHGDDISGRSTKARNPTLIGYGSGPVCVGEELGKIIWKAFPELHGTAMVDQNLYQLANGLHIICKAAVPMNIVPLLYRGHKWMQSQTSLPQHVDAVAKYYVPGPKANEESCPGRHGFWSDSTCTTEHHSNLHQPLVAKLRKWTNESGTFEVKIKGGYSIHSMAVDISRAFTFGRRIFDSIVCVYQMPDRAWVDKRSQKVHVRMTKMEKWIEDIELFCKVTRAAAKRVLVITADLSCFPIFAQKAADYEHHLKMLRSILDKYNICWDNAKNLSTFPTFDGYHFKDDCLDCLLNTACSWFQQAIDLPETCFNPDEYKSDVLRAIAADAPHGKKMNHWWELRSQVSGSSYCLWCFACDTWIRGGHTSGEKHKNNMLCRFGLEFAADPPFVLSSEISLPPGMPKVLDTETSLALAAWLTASEGTDVCRIKDVREAGVHRSLYL